LFPRAGICSILTSGGRSPSAETMAELARDYLVVGSKQQNLAFFPPAPERISDFRLAPGSFHET
jgi:hypothetical protein